MSARYNELTIVKLYKDGYSTLKLGRLFDVNTNTIRRILQKHNVSLRTFSEAQKLALDKNPSLHPTKGKHHKESSKVKTSNSMKKFRELERKAKKKAERDAKKAQRDGSGE